MENQHHRIANVHLFLIALVYALVSTSAIGRGHTTPAQSATTRVYLPLVVRASQQLLLSMADEIWSVFTDGHGLRNLSNHPGALHSHPQWSPDGTKILFISDRVIDNTMARQRVWVMQADGTQQTCLTLDPGEFALGASWAPDGAHIAFLSRRTGWLELYVMEATGAHPIRITRFDSPTTVHQARLQPTLIPQVLDTYNVVWSPGGQMIAFEYPRADGGIDLYTIRTDGTQLHKLNPSAQLNAVVHARSPTWSPDGSQLAFTGDMGPRDQIYVVRADGTQLTQLTQNQGRSHWAVWSPTSQQLAFVAERDGAAYIYRMNADGSQQVALTNQGSTTNWSPTWSPDGTMIAFSTYTTNAETQIRIIRADGTPIRTIQEQEKIVGPIRLHWNPQR